MKDRERKGGVRKKISKGKQDESLKTDTREEEEKEEGGLTKGFKLGEIV